MLRFDEPGTFHWSLENVIRGQAPWGNKIMTRLSFLGSKENQNVEKGSQRDWTLHNTALSILLFRAVAASPLGSKPEEPKQR